MNDSNHKDISELTFSDFAVYPIWTWVEDDENESLVMPVDYVAALSEDHGTLFVACEFSLHDDTKMAGVLSVRMSDHFVYLLSFPKAGGGFFDFSLHPQLKKAVNREQFAAWLQKPPTRIFPITYNTPYVFSDGQPLIGQIK
jgi:hypothetical protein